MENTNLDIVNTVDVEPCDIEVADIAGVSETKITSGIGPSMAGGLIGFGVGVGITFLAKYLMKKHRDKKVKKLMEEMAKKEESEAEEK